MKKEYVSAICEIVCVSDDIVRTSNGGFYGSEDSILDFAE